MSDLVTIPPGYEHLIAPDQRELALRLGLRAKVRFAKLPRPLPCAKCGEIRPWGWFQADTLAGPDSPNNHRHQTQMWQCIKCVVAEDEALRKAQCLERKKLRLRTLLQAQALMLRWRKRTEVLIRRAKQYRTEGEPVLYSQARRRMLSALTHYRSARKRFRHLDSMHEPRTFFRTRSSVRRSDGGGYRRAWSHRKRLAMAKLQREENRVDVGRGSGALAEPASGDNPGDAGLRCS